LTSKTPDLLEFQTFRTCTLERSGGKLLLSLPRERAIRSILFLSVLLVCAQANADVVLLSQGERLEGVVLQQTDEQVTLCLKYGIVQLPRSDVLRIDIHKEDISTSQPTTRLSSWEAAVRALAIKPWATGFTQIPPTVIDNGVMRDVPYKSHKCGRDYEMNVYGDPDAPAGIEIGVYRTLLNSAEAKQNCMDFITSLLGPEDAAIVRAADKSKDLITRNGLTVEVTPPDAPDAYGGWWISVYDQKALDDARASAEELKAISVPKAAPIQPLPMDAPNAASASSSDWQPADMDNSRPSSDDAGKTVYVRGYYRQNGTYVNSYYRSPPGSGYSHK